MINPQVRSDSSVFLQVLTSDIAQAVDVDVVEDSGRKMYMTGKDWVKAFCFRSFDYTKTFFCSDLTVDYSREGTVQPALNSLTVQVFGCVAENCDILHLKRATPIKWKYDGVMELLVLLILLQYVRV